MTFSFIDDRLVGPELFQDRFDFLVVFEPIAVEEVEDYEARLDLVLPGPEGRAGHTRSADVGYGVTVRPETEYDPPRP